MAKVTTAFILALVLACLVSSVFAFDLVVGLKHTNPKLLHQRFIEISGIPIVNSNKLIHLPSSFIAKCLPFTTPDPHHERYLQHLSVDDIALIGIVSNQFTFDPYSSTNTCSLEDSGCVKC